MGLRDDVKMKFGKFRGKSLAEVPSSYIRWCLEQNWFEEKYEELIDTFGEELQWRDTFEFSWWIPLIV